MYVKHHSYIPLPRFVKDVYRSLRLTYLIAVPTAEESKTLDDWTKLRRIVDRVHLHTCIQASYSDRRTLLS